METITWYHKSAYLAFMVAVEIYLAEQFRMLSESAALLPDRDGPHTHIVTASGDVIGYSASPERVKGLCFHPTQPLVLASYHDGSILCWNVSTGIAEREFRNDTSLGAVRCVAFHPSGKSFASCADDSTITIWDFDTPYPLCTLLGHSDFVRSVAFHPTYPLLLSASDDQSLRIWDWTKRCCIAVAKGHSHYAMHAQWSPLYNIIASASLDQTVILWDVSAVCATYERMTSGGTREADLDDVLSLADEPEKHIEKHITRIHTCSLHHSGVNHVTFHPTLPLLLSSSDDHSVAVWAYTSTSVTLQEQLIRDHTNNVSGAAFVAGRQGTASAFVTVSEDCSIKQFQQRGSTWNVVWSDKRSEDRGWSVECHKSLPLIAAGFDSGLKLYHASRQGDNPPLVFLQRSLDGVRIPPAPRPAIADMFADFPPAVSMPFSHKWKVEPPCIPDENLRPAVVFGPQGTTFRELSRADAENLRTVRYKPSLSLSWPTLRAVLFAIWPSIWIWYGIYMSYRWKYESTDAWDIIFSVFVILVTIYGTYRHLQLHKERSRLQSLATPRGMLQQCNLVAHSFYATMRAHRGPSVEEYRMTAPLQLRAFRFWALDRAELNRIPSSNVVVSFRPVFCANSQASASAVVEVALRVQPPDALRSNRVTHTGSLTAKLEGLVDINDALDASRPKALAFYPSDDWLSSRPAYIIAGVLDIEALHSLLLAARTTHVEVPMVWVLDKGDAGATAAQQAAIV